MGRGLALKLSSDATMSLHQKFGIDRRPTRQTSELLQAGVEPSKTEDDCEDGSGATESSSWPVILLDAKRLTGYLPADDDEADAMVQSLRTTGLLNNEDRLLDMFAKKLARHGVAMSGKRSDFLVIRYPNCLRTNLQTQSVWKNLLNNHDIPVVDRIFQYLASCHQPLLWKHHMKIEITRIVDQETSFRELQHWKRRRSAELEQLYIVRETIAHRAEIEQALLESLLKERDQSMVKRMKDRSGLISFDLHSTVFSFPDSDNQIMGFTTDDNEFYFGKTEETSDDDDDYWCQSRGDNRLALNEQVHKKQLREATRLEDTVRDECTSTALRVSMAKAAALKKQLEKVDSLLETIQDEEWAEAESNDEPHLPEFPDPNDSVLTPILAMILGSSELSHQTLIVEHANIVKQWESYFGRLPPLPKQRSHEQEEREKLGIVENDDESWGDQSSESDGEYSNNELESDAELWNDESNNESNDELSRCD